MFSVRLICVDSYQAAPIPDVDPTFSEFKGSEIKQVPILRIFGTTPNGQKVCLHIHGVFPYLYVPYFGQVNADILAYRLAASLDQAINVSFGSGRSNTQHIYKIQQVSGVPFYGYHKRRHHFFKIYFYNPSMMKKAIDLLQNGCILDQTFQPHEAHIPYTLQFMIDFNLYGMSLIQLNNVKFRHDSSMPISSEDNFTIFNSNESCNIGFAKEYLPLTVTKQSICEIEIDACASDIINRKTIEKGLDLNPGVAAIWDEEKARRAHKGLNDADSQLEPPKSPERGEIVVTDNDVYQQERLNRRLITISQMNSDSSSSPLTDQTCYPLEVPDNSRLLNASQIEIHSNYSELNNSCKSNLLADNLGNEGLNHSLPIQTSFSAVELSLNDSDYDVVEMLANLAEESENEKISSIDNDSILGSQKTEQDVISQVDDDTEDNDEVPDLNLTNSELLSINFSSWNNESQRSQISQLDFSLSSRGSHLDSNTPSNVSVDTIPQLDGPLDDENTSMIHLGERHLDVTVEREETRICQYKSAVKRKNDVISVTTPSKRRRISSTSSEDSINEIDATYSSKKNLPKTPRRSRTQRTPRTTPSKRSGNLTSPSCPKRYYSPLNVEISNSPKNSPCTPSKNSCQYAQVKKSSQFKRLFSPVKELNLEDETDDNAKKQEVDKLFSKISVKDFDSDCTLVEDSDEDTLDKTLKEVPQSQRRIIDETDDTSNDSYASNFSNKNKTFSGQNLDEEKKNLSHELSFTDYINTIQTNIFSQTAFNSFSCQPNNAKEKLINLKPKFLPPSVKRIKDTFELYNIRKCNNIVPFFSKQDDIVALPQNQACRGTKLKGKGLASLPSFKSNLDSITGINNWRKMKVKEFCFSDNNLNSSNLRKELAGRESIIIEPLKLPPHREKVNKWLKAKKIFLKDNAKSENTYSIRDANKSEKSISSTSNELSPNTYECYKDCGTINEFSKHLGISCGQIEFNTRPSIHPEDENVAQTKVLTTYQYLSILCIEVHVNTRQGFLPDPRIDSIAAVFYAIHNDVPVNWSKAKPLDCGAIIVNLEKCNKSVNSTLNYVDNEESLIKSVISIVKKNDPEILIGWDIEFLSWGYLFHRASIFGINFGTSISRIPSTKYNWNSETNATQSSSDINLDSLRDVKLPGRIVLDIWRLMRHEIALNSYTYENIMYHVLNERIPLPNFDTLTQWWNIPTLRWRVVDHYSNKVIGILRILQHLDLINRTSEYARLFGIQFYEVFSRGSQFRVESMMLRLAKPLNYIPVSPSSHQRASMRAPESLPLIMEPESMIYTDPVIVLDFQSLYPSIIIAYNYCFSTCLGRVEYIGSPQPFDFGATNLMIPKKLALKLQGKINFSPCGVGFVKKNVRLGILPRMLKEILDTRLMVKKAIKDHSKDDKALLRALDSRQLGLKLIANVTYGYTAANFSGRMPCIEVGDSVVSKGKETLERAIRLVESTSKWCARVIYGDTDSLFVLVKGKSREDAFKIGAEIAEAVTAANPKPVKLKFEKVLQPCVLQTKKRYCGYMYENVSDEPVYLAKGIETVRRDGCPAVAKILEKSLRILFDTKDVSLVKDYVVRQLDKILCGKVSIQDLTFAKEFRGLRGYKAAACVPALELTRRLMQKDPRAVPRTGDRVPYIIVAGGPNEALIRCVCSPLEVIRNSSLRPNAQYYITKVIIPPLNRCLNLIGVDVYTWFAEMPHRKTAIRIQGVPSVTYARKQQGTLSQYIQNLTCFACGNSCDKQICFDCCHIPNKTTILLQENCRNFERNYSNIISLCQSCTGTVDVDYCSSLDCPIFYRRYQGKKDAEQIPHILKLIKSIEF